MNTRSDPYITLTAALSVRLTRWSLLLLVALLVAGVPPVAHAAQTSPPVSLSSLLLVDASGQGGTLIIAGDAAQQARLPLVLELPVPSGSQVSWVGEISGGDPSTDPTATYSVRREQDYDLVALTLTKYRRGQVEIAIPATAPGSVGQGSTGTPYAMTLPVPAAVGSASLEFDVPPGSVVSSLSAGLVKGSSSSSADQYVLTRSGVSAGSVLKASLVLAPAAAGSAQQPLSSGTTAQSPSQGPSTRSVSGLQLGLLLASVIFFVYNAFRFTRVRAARRAAEAIVGGAPRLKASDATAVPRAPRTSGSRAEQSASDGGRRVASTDRELKHLQDRRARGEMTRHEFLVAKTAILGSKQGARSSR